MYLPTGLIGYRLFGAGVQADVLSSFGRNFTSGLQIKGYQETVDIKIARLCMALTTALGYPVQVYLARIAFWDAIGVKDHSKKFLTCSYFAFTLSFAGSTLGIALILILFKLDIDFVMSITSATAGVTIQFLFPSLMLIKIGSKIKGVIGIIVSIIMAVVSLFVTFANAICHIEFPNGMDGNHPFPPSSGMQSFCHV